MVNLPIGLLALWLTGRHGTATSRRADASGIDPVGQVAAVASLGGLILALIQGGEQGWARPVVLGGMAAFVAFGIVWLVTLLPLELFRRPALSGAVAVGLLLNLGFYGQLFVMSLYLQHVRGDSPSLAGASLLPEAVAVLLASPLSGRLVGCRASRARRPGVRCPQRQPPGRQRRRYRPARRAGGGARLVHSRDGAGHAACRRCLRRRRGGLLHDPQEAPG
jgi:hypothetical protein